MDLRLHQNICYFLPLQKEIKMLGRNWNHIYLYERNWNLSVEVKSCFSFKVMGTNSILRKQLWGSHKSLSEKYHAFHPPHAGFYPTDPSPHTSLLTLITILSRSQSRVTIVEECGSLTPSICLPSLFQPTPYKSISMPHQTIPSQCGVGLLEVWNRLRSNLKTRVNYDSRPQG